MDTAIQELAQKKNNAFRDSYRVTVRWLVRMLMVTVILSGTLMWMTLDERQPKYYAAVTNGELVPIHSLSEPVLTNSFIIRWSALTVRKLFNLQFDTYQQQLSASQPRFTTGGWAKLQAALKSSGLVDSVVNNKLIVSAVVSKQPAVIAQLVINGRMTWRVQMSMLLTFTSANEQRQETLVVTMNVRRVPTLTVAQGIQISDFVAVAPQ